ncbi:AFG2-interacting ribosome maturation factor [Platichthys flesus]|uniref:AFG2-interacting ribosome maturation factor n=1 Tax=Platichthys flesus TaxID=8260 RepID=UPI002DB82355|nr:AFG2-interacting ribosome maturation factor [Platichthys flesus]
MSKPEVASVHQALRKGFKTVESNQQVWKSVLAECDPLMVSLGNLAEQSRALSRVHIPNTPLRDFPDLEERLGFKLSLATDTVLLRLHEKMSSLQSVRDAISNQVVLVVQLYEQNTDSLDVLSVTERSPITPSIADMLEWLQDAERHYRQQFLRRKTLLQMLRADNLSLLESAPKRWKSLESPSAEDGITDSLCKVSFFVDSE